MSDSKIVDRDTVLTIVRDRGIVEAIVAYLRTKVQHPGGKSCGKGCPFAMSGYEHHEAEWTDDDGCVATTCERVAEDLEEKFLPGASDSTEPPVRDEEHLRRSRRVRVFLEEPCRRLELASVWVRGTQIFACAFWSGETTRVRADSLRPPGETLICESGDWRPTIEEAIDACLDNWDKKDRRS